MGEKATRLRPTRAVRVGALHQENAIARFGRMTAWSVALAAASGASAALSLWRVIPYRA
jgi:hypothetical protein